MDIYELKRNCDISPCPFHRCLISFLLQIIGFFFVFSHTVFSLTSIKKMPSKMPRQKPVSEQKALQFIVVTQDLNALHMGLNKPQRKWPPFS